MGFRFRKRIKILPGVNLNLSKSGISTSLGGKGATINVGKKGVNATVGVPGSGLSYSKKLSSSSQQNQQTTQQEHLQHASLGEPKRFYSKTWYWIGVAFLPLFFSLFTLKHGVPTKHRVIAIGWLIIGSMLAYLSEPPQKDTTPSLKPEVSVISPSTDKSSDKQSTLYKLLN